MLGLDTTLSTAPLLLPQKYSGLFLITTMQYVKIVQLPNTMVTAQMHWFMGHACFLSNC